MLTDDRLRELRAMAGAYHHDDVERIYGRAVERETCEQLIAKFQAMDTSIGDLSANVVRAYLGQK